jgi:hypothetical protein
MIGYSKSEQLGKVVNPKKKNKNGQTVSRSQEWEKARAKLKLIYQSHGITKCEFVALDNHPCHSTSYLTFAHRNKRRNLEPGDLSSINETLLLCIAHHEAIEHNEEETERLFNSLRPII